MDFCLETIEFNVIKVGICSKLNINGQCHSLTLVKGQSESTFHTFSNFFFLDRASNG